MKAIRVGAAVLNQTPLDWRGNEARIREAIDRARDEGISVLCLPEMCISGYGCEDAFHAPGLQARALEQLDRLRAECRGMVVSFGLPLLYRNALFNAVAIVVDGQIAGFVAKRYLAGDGIHYEPRWFNPWPRGKRDDIDLLGGRFPIGDIFFDVGGVKIGLEVCEDAWVAQRPGADLAYLGADLILNPSASHFAFGKLTIRKGFVVEGSRAFSVSYLYSNLLGNESGRAIFDGGALIASAGRLLACGPRFGYRDLYLTSAVIDVDRTRMIQARTHSFRPTFDDDAAFCVEAPFAWPQNVEAPHDPALDALEAAAPPRASVNASGAPAEPGLLSSSSSFEESAHLKEEEFSRAIALGLFDYMRKSRSKGFVVSLSGGADSTACACLVALMVRLATDELGFDEFARRSGLGAAVGQPQRDDRVGHPGPSDAGAERLRLVRRLLTCAYQATHNSSETTRNAAESVARSIGATYLELDVDALVEGYVSLVSRGIGRTLDWEHDDITLQNIQARTRGPGVWMLANLNNALLLATSNRSEAAVGYATMDGDTCGGLSPIAGIDKAFLRRWLRWMEELGPLGVGPNGALSTVTAQAPTAELRPPSEGQTDEGDLMPYPLLDAIERAAIRDKQMPVEVYRTMRGAFLQYTPQQLGPWIERFFRLWCRNQWKRERFAPSFHVDDENLDPRTWCRFPILSGGFVTELDELRAVVEADSRPH
ncbi:MAG: NAD(+) synthase [Myxococcales bacterium]|nr:NAD(+) synthase [Myxococcales bacterium]